MAYQSTPLCACLYYFFCGFWVCLKSDIPLVLTFNQLHLSCHIITLLNSSYLFKHTFLFPIPYLFFLFFRLFLRFWACLMRDIPLAFTFNRLQSVCRIAFLSMFFLISIQIHLFLLYSLPGFFFVCGLWTCMWDIPSVLTFKQLHICFISHLYPFLTSIQIHLSLRYSLIPFVPVNA